MDNSSYYRLFLLIFISLWLHAEATFGTTSKVSDAHGVKCIEGERRALLKFKQGVIDDYAILSSWSSGEDNKECCKWWGVKCSNRTGHVIVLDLHMDSSAWIYGPNLRGKLSHSLSELQQLRYLDLSFNDFSGRQMGEVIGSLQRLKYFNLSHNGFTGAVPHQLGNLTTLQTLDLGFNNGLTTDNLEWLSQLRSLRRLDLSDTYLKASNWLEVIVNLPSLEELRLSTCWLYCPTPFSLVLPNSSSDSLSALDLSFNFLTSSSVYPWFFNISNNLVSVDLRMNRLEGPIPDAFGEMISLQDIDLAGNLLEGAIPKSFQNLSHLRSLSLWGNRLSEPLPELLGKLSMGAHKSLESLYLNMNQLSGPLTDLTRFSSLKELHVADNQLNGSLLENFLFPSSLLYLDLSNNQITGNFLLHSFFRSPIQFFRLEYLVLSGNQISGELPSNLTIFPSLRVVDLNNNRLRGRIPESIGQLSKLEILDLSSNVLEGSVSQVHFSKLFNLKELRLSFNSLTLNTSSQWVPTFQLDFIFLANCSMGPHFPQWLKTQNSFSELDLSFGSISDTLPDWFWDLSPTLEYLNLSYNLISGRLSELSQKFHGYPRIDLSSNNFSGEILSIPLNLTLLHLHKNMLLGSISFVCVIRGAIFRSLDLSNNQFSGKLPNCLMNMTELVILNLANNNFSGQIPKSFGFLNQLQTLHLRNNSFIGEFPSSLKDCTQLKVIDIGANKLTGNIPAWIGTHLTGLVILSLRSNKFHGNIPQDICHLSNMKILDLSRNNITGKIPHCLYNLTSLAQKNSSSRSIIIRFSAYDDGFHYSCGDYMDNVLVQWKKQESEYQKILGYLKTIDLSSNKIVGQIPQEIASLRGLISLNLSANHLTGNIVEHIGEMEMLESLDLSRNQLSGVIPAGLAHLHYLSVLDLSYNNLSGRIPSSTQLQTFNTSSYIGNNELCGLPLEKCPRDAFEPQIRDHKKNSKVQNEVELTREFYLCIGSGFLFGLLGSFAIMLKASWRNAYFQFLENINDWVYVTSRVYMARLTRMLSG